MTEKLSQEKSTIVRKIPRRLRLIRRALAWGEHWSPQVAGRSAVRLWCTPPSPAGRRQDNRTAPGLSSIVVLAGGRRVQVETWAPAEQAAPAPTIYLAHGWGGWRGQLGAFVEPLRAAGFRVVGFDAPAHGDSGPGGLGRNQASGIEFAETLAAVARVHGPAAGVIAHSLGAATTILALRDGLTVGRLVLIAPSSDPMSVVGRFQRELGLGRRTAVEFLLRLHRVAGRPLTDLNALTVPDSVPRPPTLIIHDRDDSDTSFAEAERLAVRWPADLIGTDGLGHHRILRDPEVVAAAARFLGAAPEPDRTNLGAEREEPARAGALLP